MKIRLVEAFAGIGSQVQALKNIGIDVETVGIFEIDKYAVKSYEAIHGEVTNFGDISQDVDIPSFDLFTYSFPCQDISNAGEKRGFDKGSGTRSSLLWECEKIIEKYRPPFLLMENVKALVSKKNLPNFEKWLALLESYGYTSYWQVLNAKDYGVPQNRERVFCVSVLDGRGYNFPEPVPLEKHLVDIMESNVDERFYLKQETIDKLVFKHGADPNAVMWSAEFLKHHDVVSQNDVSFCVTTRVANGKNYVNETRRDEILQIGKEHSEKRDNPNHNRVYDPNGIAPTIDTMQGGNRQPCVLTTDICIRKLTPLECWRLMGFSDEAFHKAEAVNSNTQLYKQAGNSIVVDVLEAIFTNLFLKKPEYTQTSLF